jgi:hypothetical protein
MTTKYYAIFKFHGSEEALFAHLETAENHATDYKARDKEALLLALATDGSWTQ